MKIEVTQEHIDKGEKNSCRNCPLALALKVHFLTAMVGSNHWWEPGSGKPVQPFTFEV